MRFLLSILFLSQLVFAPQPAQAGPFDFFKRIRDSIAGHQQPTKKTTHARSVRPSPTVNPVRPPEPKEIEEEPTATPSPSVEMTAVASRASPSAKRVDLPYGMPVANRPGFVRSPYSPDSGYVDIRGFTSGTEVKDPYTGKVFLTP